MFSFKGVIKKARNSYKVVLLQQISTQVNVKRVHPRDESSNSKKYIC